MLCSELAACVGSYSTSALYTQAQNNQHALWVVCVSASVSVSQKSYSTSSVACDAEPTPYRPTRTCLDYKPLWTLHRLMKKMTQQTDRHQRSQQYWRLFLGSLWLITLAAASIELSVKQRPNICLLIASTDSDASVWWLHGMPASKSHWRGQITSPPNHLVF